MESWEAHRFRELIEPFGNLTPEQSEACVRNLLDMLRVEWPMSNGDAANLHTVYRVFETWIRRIGGPVNVAGAANVRLRIERWQAGIAESEP